MNPLQKYIIEFARASYRGSEKVQAGTQNSVIAKLTLLNFRFGLGQCPLESNLFGGRLIKINGIICLETWGGWPKIINGQ